MITWIIGGILLAILLGAFWYWAVIVTEGAYLGQRIVTKLYDGFAYKYNRVKDFDTDDETQFLGLPLMQSLGYNFGGVVLDVATGTGRLPLALTAQSAFRGTVIGLDHSAKMLVVARGTLPNTVLLIQGDAMRLPFARESVGGVTCLEALEFLPNPVIAAQEMARVLSGGGILLTTNRVGWETRLMPGKAWSTAQAKEILSHLDLVDIRIHPWLDIYSQIWARKT